jgi:polysaccharide chain length determinant protein (PEP-CTERM system associated)
MFALTEIRRYVAGAWRHRWKAVLLAWLVCLGGWAAVSRMPDVYVSNARVVADADAILTQTLRDIAVPGAPAAQVELLQRTLLSRPNLERIIARTDLDLRVRTPSEREALIAELGRRIRLAPQARNLFRIEFSDRDPRIAQAVVRTTLDLFIERAAQNDRAQMDNARNFVTQQLQVYETQLRDAERRRAEFRARYFELLPSDQFGGGSRLQAARGRQVTLRGELEDAQARRDVLRNQFEQMPENLTPERTVGGGGGGGGRLAEAERQLRELRLRFTDNHPDVIATRSMIAELRATGGGGGGPGAPATRIPATPNPQREALGMRLLDADVQIASIERQIRENSTEIERLEGLARTVPQVQAQMTNMDRDYNVIRRQYEELLERRESLQVAGAARTGADQVRLEIVEPPTVPTRPSGPNRPLFYTVVLVAGLGAGAAVAVLLALLDRSFYTVNDLRRIGLPVLGAISSLKPRRQAAAITVFAGAVGLLIVTYGAVLAGGPRIVARLIA